MSLDGAHVDGLTGVTLWRCIYRTLVLAINTRHAQDGLSGRISQDGLTVRLQRSPCRVGWGTASLLQPVRLTLHLPKDCIGVRMALLMLQVLKIC